MNISGIRPNAGFYDYNSIQNIRNAVEDTPVVKTVADAGASEQQQKDTLETPVRREQDFGQQIMQHSTSRIVSTR